MLRAVAIGLAVGIGAFWGRRIAIWFGFCLLLVSPLKAQVYYGDTLWQQEGRKETRGWFFVDTTDGPGWHKSDPKRQWVEEIKPSLLYWDLWQQTAACQGVPTNYAEFKRHRFFAINRDSFGGRGPLQIGYYGYYLSDSMAIYVARPRANDRAVLMHEMSHALQFLRGWKVNHSFRWFGPFFCGFSYVTIGTADKEERR